MKSILSALILFSISYNMNAQNDTIIYIGDPLCSWCYGVADEIQKVKDNNSEEFEFKLVIGGLRPYNTETMADLSDFLKHHWDDVSERSGKEFNYSILQDKAFVYDTEPPSRAVWVMRELNPKNEFSFFKDIQKLFYYDNKNTNELESYRELVIKYDVEFGAFSELYNSTDARLGIKQDFEYSTQLGVKGFPSVVLKKGSEYFLIANGYNTAENIQKIIDKITASN